MDDLEVKNDKRRLIITSTVIIIILLLVGFGVLRLFLLCLRKYDER